MWCLHREPSGLVLERQLSESGSESQRRVQLLSLAHGLPREYDYARASPWPSSSFPLRPTQWDPPGPEL